MKFLQLISVKRAIIYSFALLILFTLISSTASVVSTNNSINASHAVDRIIQVAYNRVKKAQASLSNVNVACASLFNEDINELSDEEYLRLYKESVTTLNETLSTLIPGEMGTQSYADNINKVIKLSKDYVKIVENQVMPIYTQGATNTALKQYIAHAMPNFNEAIATFDKIFAEQMFHASNFSKEGANNAYMIISIVITVIAVIMALVVCFFLTSHITQSVNRIIHHTDCLAQGDLTEEITVTGKDEFSLVEKSLATAKDKMRKALTRAMSELSHASEKMYDLTEKATSMVHALQDSDSKAITVAAASDEMVSTTTDIARNCEGAAAASDESKRITSDGVHSVRTAVDGVRSQRESTKKSAQMIEDLAKQTNEIGSILSTIEDIAAQTNLLALNAAIEAARAGEAGRGFAVVADEVRTLATRTAASTQSIDKMVTNIQSEVSSVTSFIEDSVKEMDVVASNAENIEQILNDITEHVISVNSQITQIATAAEQQTTATAEISTNMQVITASASEVSEKAKLTSDELTNMKEGFDHLVSDLNFFKV